MKTLKQLLFIGICFFMTNLSTKAQEIKKTYFDSLEKETNVANAFYYRIVEKQGNVYNAKWYYVSNGALASKGICIDEICTYYSGNLITYYANGRLKDSIVFFDKGSYIFHHFNYHSLGQLADSIRYQYEKYYIKNYTQTKFSEEGKEIGTVNYDPKLDKYTSKYYDKEGNLIPNYTIYEPTGFKGGAPAWTKYLERNLRAEIPIKKNAPRGKYTVIISFFIDENGNAVDIEALNNPGYGTKEEAIRVIQNCPLWKPEIVDNKPKKVHKKQPISFVVE